MELYVNMLFIMNDISPVESSLDSVEKPTQITLAGIHDRVTHLIQKPGRMMRSDSKLVPITIGSLPASICQYGPTTRDEDKDLPLFEIIVNGIISEPDRPHAIRKRSYYLFDASEPTDKDRRFRIESYDDIELPHDVSEIRKKGAGLLYKKLSHRWLQYLARDTGAGFVNEDEAKKLL